ncbi:MAG TPA: ATP-binding cassette domain-containing protein, partial [Clostridia bacterium]|nr:ATP-binding cassette domain-containing protein [Clostridia bacterium]
QLFADTVAADVAFGPKNMKLPPEEIKKRVSEALNLVGLNEEEVGEKSPFDLSGGERRRAAIAGVLAMKPKILVLDEPTAGLDPMGKREILQLMAKIRAEQKATIIMISHDMNEIYENVDRVAVFVEGTIKYDMPTQELFAKVKIEDYGLEMPAMAVIKKKLAKKGINISGRTVSEVFDEIVKVKGGKNV